MKQIYGYEIEIFETRISDKTPEGFMLEKIKSWRPKPVAVDIPTDFFTARKELLKKINLLAKEQTANNPQLWVNARLYFGEETYEIDSLPLINFTGLSFIHFINPNKGLMLPIAK